MKHARPHERGIALILVLWVFMVLGVLAMDFARYMRDDAQAAINLAEETRGYYVALAGMNRALFETEQAREQAGGALVTEKVPGEESDEDELSDVSPADGLWHEGTFKDARYAVRTTDEGGRIPLNRVSETLLKRVVTNLFQGGNATTGMDLRQVQDADTVVDSILDWIDPDNLSRIQGAESDYYQSLRPPYRAKNGFFDSAEELLLVKGLTPALFYGSEGRPGLRDIVSVYNRSGHINVRTAPAVVLQVLLGVEPSAAVELVTERETEGGAIGGDGAPLFFQRVQALIAAANPELSESLTDQVASTVTLEARADMSQERNRASVAAVVDLSGDAGDGVRIIRWLDRAPFTIERPVGEAGTS